MSNSADEPWPVRKVSRLIGEWIGRLGTVWVEGQVAGLARRPGMAVVFATLRDPAADMSLAMTIPLSVLGATEPPVADGQRVVVLGRPEFHPRRGSLQLVVTEIRAVGVGALLARLERLKALLQQEGLFAPERKKPLPFLPRVVGVICGRESAARRDVEENARRRWPAVRLEVREVAVQGPGAAGAVIAALRELDQHPEVDVVVITRGGGSVEDLLPFSDEALCRAVAAARTPVVSAIGHETDTPLLDFVADWRASTPTDAAKRVVPDVAEETARIARLRRAAWRCVDGRVERESQWLASARARPVLAAPHHELDRRAGDVAGLVERARRAVDNCVDRGEREVTQLQARVAALSPKATLDRGYAVVQHPDGRVVREPAETSKGERLGVRVAGGRFDVVVSDPGRAAGAK